VLKTTTINVTADPGGSLLVRSPVEWIRNAAIGPIPGWGTFAAVVLFYGWLLYLSVRMPKGEGELAFGDVHV
jgi:uncharacterized membrane protein